MDRKGRESREDGLVTIREYLYPVQAEWARNVLASAGICCLVPDGSTTYLFNMVAGVRIQVPSEKAQEAEDILAGQEFVMGLSATCPEEDEVAPGEEAPAEEPEEVTGALDPHDLCPLPPPIPCPACGGTDTDPADPPPSAAESGFESLLRRFSGRPWMACSSCGHIWEHDSVHRP